MPKAFIVDDANTGVIVRFERDGFGVVKIDADRYGWFSNNDVVAGDHITRTSVGSEVTFEKAEDREQSPHLRGVRIRKAG